MTYKEAHKILEEQQRTLTGHYGARSADEKLIEANGVAILAVEKQIPKRATIKRGDKHGKVPDVYCSVCGTMLGSGYAPKWLKHCHECGQAIDWSEDACEELRRKYVED